MYEVSNMRPDFYSITMIYVLMIQSTKTWNYTAVIILSYLEMIRKILDVGSEKHEL